MKNCIGPFYWGTLYSVRHAEQHVSCNGTAVASAIRLFRLTQKNAQWLHNYSRLPCVLQIELD